MTNVPMTNAIVDPLVESVDSDADSLLVRIEATPDGAATVWIDRPGVKNALDSLTIAALREAFETLHGAEGVRIVFLRGAGGAFSAGVDPEGLRETADLTEDEVREDALDAAKMLKTLADLPSLTVALVEGAAFGLGAGLVAVCDLAVATAHAQFAFDEVRRGLIPAVAGPYAVAALGPRAARGLFATGRAFDAAHAQAIGLVDEVVADAAALAAAQSRLSREIMACAPGVVAEAKRLVADIAAKPVDHELMRETAHRAARARTGDEGREGLAAALEGRDPAWTSL